MTPLVKEIVGAVKQGLSLWEKYIDTRQSAYNRKMDKRKRKAIDYAEQFILAYYEDEVDNKEKYLRRKRDLFFKYNN